MSLALPTPSVTPDQRLRVVLSLMLSMTLAALGNGLAFSYIPIVLDRAGEPTWVAGAMVASLAIGALAMCLASGLVLKLLGSARAFMLGIVVLGLSYLGLMLPPDPVVWAGSRFVYGGAMTLMFIVSQSWINASVSNQIRGRTQATYYTLYIVGLGVGAFGIGYVDLSDLTVPLIGMGICGAALLPFVVPGLPKPPKPTSAKGQLNFRRAWQISPVGFVGMFAVGGLTMLVQGFAPIFGQSQGFEPKQIGLMMLLMQGGIIAVQMPAGMISDKVDRRWVLFICALLIALSAGLTSQVTGMAFIVLVMAFGLWSGSTETIYSVSFSQANDWAEDDDYGLLSTTLTTVWSFSAALTPSLASYLTSIFGVEAYMYVAGSIGLTYAAFVVYRMLDRAKV